MGKSSQLGGHLLHQVEQITQHLQRVHTFGSQPSLRRGQPLTDTHHTLAQSPPNPS